MLISKKYRFKKKKQDTIINKYSLNMNINLEIDLSSNSKLTEVSNILKDLPILDTDIVYNKDVNETKNDLIFGNHYIGLIIIYSISMNEFHKMNWFNSDNKNDKIYLNNTSIFIKKQKYFPLFELNEEILSQDFKYKRYIRKLLEEKYSIKKKNINNIKFYSTYEKVHNYVVILNEKLNIFIDNKEYCWHTQLDFYRLNNREIPTQKDIYSKILESNEFQLYQNSIFLPDINDNIPYYINNLKVPYKNLIELLNT